MSKPRSRTRTAFEMVSCLWIGKATTLDVEGMQLLKRAMVACRSLSRRPGLAAPLPTFGWWTVWALAGRSCRERDTTNAAVELKLARVVDCMQEIDNLEAKMQDKMLDVEAMRLLVRLKVVRRSVAADLSRLG